MFVQAALPHLLQIKFSMWYKSNFWDNLYGIFSKLADKANVLQLYRMRR